MVSSLIHPPFSSSSSFFLFVSEERNLVKIVNKLFGVVFIYSDEREGVGGGSPQSLKR